MRNRAVLVALVLALTSCTAPKPPSPVVVDALGVRFLVPAGCEHLDHGRQQSFRVGESQLSLTGRTLEPDSLTASDVDALLLRMALGAEFNADRFEIAYRKQRTVGTLAWTELETWSRLTHTQRRRVAYTRLGEQLLVLDVDRGDAGTLEPVFEALLVSIAPAGSAP